MDEKNNVINFSSFEEVYDYSKHSNIKIPIALLRYVDNNPSHLSDFENGNLYFPPMKCFIDFENNKHDSNIGDSMEGQVSFNISLWGKVIKLNNMILPVAEIDNINTTIKYTTEELENTGIVSFFMLTITDLIRNNKGELKLKPGIYRDLESLEDGSNRTLFLVNDIIPVLSELKTKKVMARPVTYYNPFISDIDIIVKLENNRNYIPFYKRAFYSHQHEFRILKNIKSNNRLMIEAIQKNSKIIGFQNLRDMNFDLKQFKFVNC